MKNRLLFARRSSRLILSFVLILSLLAAPFADAAEMRPIEKARVSFSQAVEKSLVRAASALDKAAIALAHAVDKTDNLSVEVHSHFYDSRIRRYFISISGTALFQGKLPYKLKADRYFISTDSEVSIDLDISHLKQTRSGLSFTYEGAITVSLDRIAYEMLKKIPHLAASGALSPAFDLLTEFLAKLNIGVLSKAISETCRSFSAVAFTRLVTDLIKASGQNHGLGRFFKDALREGNILSFLALQIFRCASISLVSVTGASLGAAVGSVIAPGPGSLIGAYMGSQILSVLAKIVVYQLTAKMPLRRNMKRMIVAHRFIQKNPGDDVARKEYQDAMSKIEKEIASELNNEKFSLFETLLKETDKLESSDRQVIVPLLKNIQTLLQFKVIRDGDWYYARKYYLLKQHVDRWGLQSQIVFVVEPPAHQREAD